MSDCCSKPNKKNSLACPQCGSDCKPVPLRTLYHQIRFPENQHISTDHFYYCSSRDCATAYFSATGMSLSKSLLLTQQKIQQNMLCYCFDITAANYLSALQSRHEDAIKGFVLQRTKVAECACEVRNPSGQCCLAKFKQFEKEYVATNISQES